MDPVAFILGGLCLLLLALVIAIFELYEHRNRQYIAEQNAHQLARHEADEWRMRHNDAAAERDDAASEHARDLASIHRLHEEAMEQAQRRETALRVEIQTLKVQNNGLIARTAVRGARKF